MMMRSSAQVGGHLTLIFSVQDDAEALLEQGSRGAGFCLDRGVKVEASAVEGTGQLSIEGDAPGHALFETVLDELSDFEPRVKALDWSLIHTSDLPVSQGFGLSAAGAISTALAMQRALGVEAELARARSIHIAHRVERRLSGGLGDVAALHVGGVELRLEPGCPQLAGDLGGPGAVLSWHADIPVVLGWRLTASQHTSRYIDDGEWKLAIRAAGEKALFGLREGRWEAARWGELLEKSAQFAETSGLLADADRLALLHLCGSALAGAGHADGSLSVRLCMLGESVVVVPTTLDSDGEWKASVVESLRARGLGAAAANIASDALNLR
jgi:pantoate kinase